MPKHSTERSTAPTDENSLAKWIVDLITIEAKAQPEKNPADVALRWRGRLKGDKSSAAKLSSSKRKAIGKNAAKAR